MWLLRVVSRSKVHSQLEHWIIEWQATNLNFCSRACLSVHQRLQLLPANKVTRLNIDMHFILLFLIWLLFT